MISLSRVFGMMQTSDPYLCLRFKEQEKSRWSNLRCDRNCVGSIKGQHKGQIST